MSTTIDIKVPLCRYGNIVLNKAYVHSADLRSGVVIMEGGVRYEFPPEVVQKWFADIENDINWRWKK